MSQSPFLEYLAEVMFERRYSKRSIEAYCKWVKAFINFNNHRHPKMMNEEDVLAFLNLAFLNMANWLASTRPLEARCWHAGYTSQAESANWQAPLCAATFT